MLLEDGIPELDSQALRTSFPPECQVSINGRNGGPVNHSPGLVCVCVHCFCATAFSEKRMLRLLGLATSSFCHLRDTPTSKFLSEK